MLNRGHGAGGANTNKNGLPYEILTDLESEYEKVATKNCKHTYDIRFHVDEDEIFIVTKQSSLFKVMDKHINKNVTKAHGCKNPDECFIHEKSKSIFIIEKKFQQISGSVCEKIQTSHFKKWQYSRTFPEYNIHYVYCLSGWFKENCKAEIEYLIEVGNVPVFWGNSLTYKQDIIAYILEHCK